MNRTLYWSCRLYKWPHRENYNTDHDWNHSILQVYSVNTTSTNTWWWSVKYLLEEDEEWLWWGGAPSHQDVQVSSALSLSFSLSIALPLTTCPTSIHRDKTEHLSMQLKQLQLLYKCTRYIVFTIIIITIIIINSSIRHAITL